MPPIAHSGGTHWYESIIYLIPIIGFGLWLAVTYIKDRVQGRDRTAENTEPEARAEAEALNRAERRAAERVERKINKGGKL